MIERITLATPEEVEAIKDKSNLTPSCRVLKMDEVIGVWRICHELDPLIPNGASNSKLFRFMAFAEHLMKGAGATEYFFNVPADDPTYHAAIEKHFGAERLSKQPDYRYRVNF